MRGLACQEDISVSLLKLNKGEPRNPLREVVTSLRALEATGVAILDPLDMASARTSTPTSNQTGSYSDSRGRVRVYESIEKSAADVVLVPLSEWVTSLLAEIPAIRVAYYGNPDPKVIRARAALDRKFKVGYSHLDYAAALVRARVMEAKHVKEMKNYQLIGNVAANDAIYYKRKGHPNSDYIQNIWIDRGLAGGSTAPDWDETSPVRIVGSVGKLSSTANSFGLHLLGAEFVPLLRKAMSHPFLVDIFGEGLSYPEVMRGLATPDVRIRGFVPDIDTELQRAHIFLCLNNASPFKVCHTRYLHAWSLGCCVVGHVDARLSIPELQHGHNALLGDSLESIADLVAAAARDRKLRQRLARAGFETFRRSFTGERVAKSLVSKILALAQG